MSMEEVNEKFPLTKYKTWRSHQAERGLPTAGGIATDSTSRPASIRDVSRESEEPTKHTELATTQTVSTTAEPTEKPVQHGAPEVVGLETDAQPSTPRPKTATSAPDTPMQKVTTNDEEEEDDHIQTAVPAAQLPDPGDTCAICIDTLEDDDDVRGLSCGHAFHASCVDPWLTSRRACCPLCKADYYVPKPRLEGEGQQPTAPQLAFIGGRERRPTMVLPGRFMSIVYDERDRYGFPRVVREETPAERRRRERREQRIRERNGEAPPAAAEGADQAAEDPQDAPQQPQRGGWRSRFHVPHFHWDGRAGSGGNTLLASEGLMPTDDSRNGQSRAPASASASGPVVVEGGSARNSTTVTPALLEAGQQQNQSAART